MLAKVPTSAPSSGGRRSSRRCSSGSSVRSSNATSAAPAASATANEAMLSRRAPAPVGPLLQGQDQAEQREREQRDPDVVDPGPLGRPRHRPQRAEREGTERTGVDQRAPPDPAPAGLVGQHAADQRPEREGDATGRAPDAQRVALALGREGDPEHRHRRRHQDRRAEALHEAPEDHHHLPARGRDQQGADREDGQPDRERDPLPQQVAQAPAEDDEGGDGQHVDADRPAERARSHLELVGDRVQRRVDRGRVDADQEQAQARGDEDRRRVERAAGLPAGAGMRMRDVHQRRPEHTLDLAHRQESISGRGRS